MPGDLSSLCSYNRWADERRLEAVRGLMWEQYTDPPAPGCRSVHSTVVHMADATRIWVQCIQGVTVDHRIVEDAFPTLEDAVQFLGRSQAAFESLLPTLTPAALARDITFNDLHGTPRPLPLWAVLRHLLNHCCYHRGQITTTLMPFGVEPPLMDLVLWAGW